jgi:hypothetical protein
MDEEAAATTAGTAIKAGQGRIVHPSTKLPLNRWLRRAALAPGWAATLRP